MMMMLTNIYIHTPKPVMRVNIKCRPCSINFIMEFMSVVPFNVDTILHMKRHECYIMI